MRWTSIPLLTTLFAYVVAIGQKSTIGFEPSNNALKLASSGNPVRIIVDNSDWKGVRRAAKDLAHDFGRVTRTNRTNDVTTGISNARPSNDSQTVAENIVIIAGTLAKSPIIDGLAKSRKIDLSAISGKWEAFISTIVETPTAEIHRALVVAGSDKRGTIYGIYDISEQIGVSPWYWWADVPSKRHDDIYALNTTKVQGSPSIKYRGFFINDEAPALSGWTQAKYRKGVSGNALVSEFYVHVYELLLRLRANYLWPGMWGSMFAVDDPKNQPLADEFGIVMGSSHTEPMARATTEQQRLMKGPWQWNFNNASMYQFMLEGAVRAKPYETVFTMGARGNHDEAIRGSDAISQLQSIFKAQQEILQTVLPASNDTPKVWTTYKELLNYYDEEGLQVPDDWTILFTDDNFGNICRLPYGNETNRPGGAGIYFHFDFVGPPRNYKWINTIQLQRTWEQMTMAFERQARTIWVVNVGDIKPLEIPTSHWFDMAYDITLFQTPNSTQWWVQKWAEREFGVEHGVAISKIVMRFSQLAGRRKWELVDRATYNVVNYDEGERVLAEWRELSKQAQIISDRLSEEYKAPFFEMVLHPVLAAATVHEVTIGSMKNEIYASQGRASTNLIADDVMKKWKYDSQLSAEFNHMLKDRWIHMMDQTHFYHNDWQEPKENILPPIKRIEMGTEASSAMGVSAQGLHYQPFSVNASSIILMKTINPYTVPQYFDIFSEGNISFKFAIKTEPFIQLTKTAGSLGGSGHDAEVRIYATIDWSKVPRDAGEARIEIESSANSASLALPYDSKRVPPSFNFGFVESEGTVSIEAEHYDKIHHGTSSQSYIVLEGYGKTLSGVSLQKRLESALTTTSAPALQYYFYTFTDLKAPATVTAILGQTLNLNPKQPLKYAISIDDSPIRTVQYVRERPKENYKEWPNNMPYGWDKTVEDCAWVSNTTFQIGPGNHTLTFWALEPGVILQKIVIDLGGVRSSYLGPPESFRVG